MCASFFAKLGSCSSGVLLFERFRHFTKVCHHRLRLCLRSFTALASSSMAPHTYFQMKHFRMTNKPPPCTFEIGPILASFYFRPFLITISIIQIENSVDGVLGIQTRDPRW